jgi:hypothetical protein
MTGDHGLALRDGCNGRSCAGALLYGSFACERSCIHGFILRRSCANQALPGRRKKGAWRAELLVQASCDNTIETCAKEDTGRFSNAAANEAFYASTQTYNLPIVYPNNAGGFEDIAQVAPEAGQLLTTAFPSLTLEEADKVLTETEGPGGGFLDDGSAFGVYSRLNLVAAAHRAAHIGARK